MQPHSEVVEHPNLTRVFQPRHAQNKAFILQQLIIYGQTLLHEQSPGDLLT